MDDSPDYQGALPKKHYGLQRPYTYLIRSVNSYFNAFKYGSHFRVSQNVLVHWAEKPIRLCLDTGGHYPPLESPKTLFHDLNFMQIFESLTCRISRKLRSVCRSICPA
ncbi:MAG: hypothetical protein Q9167_007181 [Letrouitia subvulpina]